MKIVRNAGEQISPEMFGLFFEDINYAADGGLYAEMLENGCFEAKEAHGTPDNYYMTDDFGYAWSAIYEAGEKQPRMQYVTGAPVSSANPHYLRLTAYAPGQGIANKAYDGIYAQKGHGYTVSFYARAVEYSGSKIQIAIRKDGISYGSAEAAVIKSVPHMPFADLKQDFFPEFGDWGERIRAIREMDKEGLCAQCDWNRYEVTLTPEETVRGAEFVILLDQKGTVEFDLISMLPQDAVAGIFRKDLFEALKEMNPGFIRFPGGCVVEGISLDNRYQWKRTVGEKKDRKYIQNLWAFLDDRSITDPDAMRDHTAHYGQSYGIGYYEYFLLCELLGAKPLPVIGIGAACQFRSTEKVDMDTAEFKTYIQDAIDLIEFANGSADSKWGSIRAQMGHPEPFGLEMLGIGNEQWETETFHLYEISKRFEAAIHKVYPKIKLIGTAGPMIDLPTFKEAWDFYREGKKEGRDFYYAVDEHYYVPCEWLYKNADFYDQYPRDVAVFAGEYAAHTLKKENNMESALAEAAFLTGVEKNAGVVRLTSYAPLFNRIGYSQWIPDMIWFDDKEVYLTPNYYVQKLYANHLGDHTLDLGGQIEALREENIFVSVSETKDQEVILKIVNAKEEVFTLPLLNEKNEPVVTSARAWILEGEKTLAEHMPQPSHVTEKELAINGSITAWPGTFMVVRYR